ncbi:MAG: thioesterase family protein [Pseudomonadota bacterium]
MNLLFRLIWVLIRAAFGKPHAPLTAPRQARFTVWLTDQDMFMHMTNSRYLSFADLGRVDLTARSGLRRAMKQQGWRAEICGQTMTINRMLKAPKSFLLETQIVGWTDTYLAIAQTFLRSGKNYASVNTLLSLQDRTGAMIAPQKLIDLIDPATDKPSMPKLFSDLIERTNSASASK